MGGNQVFSERHYVSKQEFVYLKFEIQRQGRLNPEFTLTSGQVFITYTLFQLPKKIRCQVYSIWDSVSVVVNN
jgi:hypothetical protein